MRLHNLVFVVGWSLLLPCTALAQRPAPPPPRQPLLQPGHEVLSWLNDWEQQAKSAALAQAELAREQLLQQLEWVAPARAWELAWGQGAFQQPNRPEDSLYLAARQVLNSGEYRRAADLFRSLAERYPNSRYTPEALYWQAFALYRVGALDDLRQALQVLEMQRARHPDAPSRAHAAVLMTRLNAALAAQGDAEAARRVREGAVQGLATCDREDMEVRAEALSALVRVDPTGAEAVIRRTLARRDECSVPLRRRALLLLSPDDAERSLQILLDVARNDPDVLVRSDAVSRMARLRGDVAVEELIRLYDQHSERTLRSVVIRYLGTRGEDAATDKLIAIARTGTDPELRREAIRALSVKKDERTTRLLLELIERQP
jgi:tetratricopeptide (TPR) repeat protein